MGMRSKQPCWPVTKMRDLALTCQCGYCKRDAVWSYFLRLIQVFSIITQKLIQVSALSLHLLSAVGRLVDPEKA